MRATTTHALLGLLAMRSWTGYELTKQARRSLHHVWPSSEANLYREQRRLVDLGWASVEEEVQDNRPRKRYRITDEGRAALRRWFATDTDPPRIEIEGILRLFLAEHADAQDLHRSLLQTAEHVRADIDAMIGQVEQYRRGEGPFPDRTYQIALVSDLVTDVLERIEGLVLEVADEVEDVRTVPTPAQHEAGRRRFDRIVERSRARRAALPSPHNDALPVRDT